MPTRGTLAAAVVAGIAALSAPPAQAQLPPLLPTPPPSRPPAPGPTPTPAPPATAPDVQVGSTTAGVNPARSGYVDDPALVPPLTSRWSRSVPTGVRSVIYGDGRLYASSGTSVIAIDPGTGRTLWTSPGAETGSVSYGQGVVVSADRDGTVRGRSAATGALLWRNRLTEVYNLDTSPLIWGGVAYVPEGDTVYALSLQTGSRLWRANGNGTDNTLATDGLRVFASYACGWTYAWNASDGRELWKHGAYCSGGGGSTPTVHAGRVYVPENRTVYDTASGAVLGRVGLGRPVVARGLGLFHSDEGLRAVDLQTGKQRWRIRKLGPSVRTGDIGYTIAIGHSLYAYGESNKLVVHSVESGRPQQSIGLRGTTTTDAGGAPASAPGLLVVPTRGRLTAYESIYRPGPGAIAAAPVATDVELGKRNTVSGVLGTSLRGVRRVGLQAARLRGGRFRSRGSVSAQPDGYFEAAAKLTRNAKLRVVAGAARSKPMRVYVYPRYRGKLRRARGNPNRIRASVTVRVPRGIRLAGRRVVLYNGQPRRKRYVRLGAARLQSAGRGRGRAAPRFNALRRVYKGDFLVFCIPRASRLGLGRADALDRRCGARRIPLR